MIGRTIQTSESFLPSWWSSFDQSGWKMGRVIDFDWITEVSSALCWRLDWKSEEIANKHSRVKHKIDIAVNVEQTWKVNVEITNCAYVENRSLNSRFWSWVSAGGKESIDASSV